MSSLSTRRLFALLATSVVCTVTATVGGAAPAYAAASGQLLIKGTGSVYSDAPAVELGITPGVGTKTFSFKVVNTGSSNQQFKVTVDLLLPGSGFTATLFSGYKAVASPYFTAAIKPGGNVVLTLKMAVNAGQIQRPYTARVQLLDPSTNALLGSRLAIAQATYQTGTTQHDLFLKTGSQPFVGGSVSQEESASALKVGGIATFTIRMQNNGATPATMTLQGRYDFDCPSNFAVTVKQGLTNVSAAVAAGTYSTGVLDPGAKKELKVSIKLIADDGCTLGGFYFNATGPDGSGFQFGSAALVAIGV